MTFVCVTFDVDYSDYIYGQNEDEFSIILHYCDLFHAKLPHIKFTFYLRLDRHMGNMWGSPDYIFRKYGKEITTLKERGHEIGWHPHIYGKIEGQWKQNTNVSEVIDELKHLIPLAHGYGLKTVRMGWGFHSNETMRLLADSGFLSDSSAMPRPKYEWEETYKDWTTSPDVPYWPSVSDYRIPDRFALPIMEIPMSVIHVKAPYDKGTVLRYINPAYHSRLFGKSVKQWIASHKPLITVTHPYELEGGRRHGLLSFDVNVFINNVLGIGKVMESQGCNADFTTISKFADLWKGSPYDKQKY